MKTLYLCCIAVLTFSLAALGEILRFFVSYPSVVYGILAATFVILVAGLAPYRIRVKNPLVLEFLVALVSLSVGLILWF